MVVLDERSVTRWSIKNQRGSSLLLRRESSLEIAETDQADLASVPYHICI